MNCQFVVIYAFFGVNFILQKFCLCKKNDKYVICHMSPQRYGWMATMFSSPPILATSRGRLSLPGSHLSCSVQDRGGAPENESLPETSKRLLSKVAIAPMEGIRLAALYSFLPGPIRRKKSRQVCTNSFKSPCQRSGCDWSVVLRLN